MDQVFFGDWRLLVASLESNRQVSMALSIRHKHFPTSHAKFVGLLSISAGRAFHLDGADHS